MTMPEVPQPCELNCIMQLIDPICDKCDAWYEFWADVDNSDAPTYIIEDGKLKEIPRNDW